MGGWSVKEIVIGGFVCYLKIVIIDVRLIISCRRREVSIEFCHLFLLQFRECTWIKK